MNNLGSSAAKRYMNAAAAPESIEYKVGSSKAESSGNDDSAEHVSVVSDITSPNSEFLTSEIGFKGPNPLSQSGTGSYGSSVTPEIDFERAGHENRENERQEIQNALERIMGDSECKRGLIALYGHSGSGKTTLARQAIQAMTVDGYFAEDKWSKTYTRDPLSILQSVIRQIGSQIQSSGNTATSEKILKEFESQNDFLKAWMPDLLGNSTPLGKAGEAATPSPQPQQPTQSIEQMKFATTTLLSLTDQPIILLVDNAQWIDALSLELLRSWLSVTNASQKMVVITCYRDDTVDVEHDVTTTLVNPLEQNEILRDSLRITKVQVLDFNIHQTSKFLAKALALEEEEIEELADLLQKKTGGNPLYLVSSLKSLCENRHISYDMTFTRWIWNMSTVRDMIAASENVVDLLRNKMNESQVAQSILPIAALLGSTLSLDLIVNVSGELAGISKTLTGIESLDERSDIEAALEACEKQGFIDRFDSLTLSTSATTMQPSLVNEVSYRFTHDRIQEAALALLTKDNLKNLQVMMGKILVESLLDQHRRIPASASDLIVFWAADVLNEADIQTNTQQRRPLSKDEMIHLNYTAGIRAMSKTSFGLAGDYFARASYAVSRRNWKESEAQCIDLYTKAAMAAYSRGASEAMASYLGTLLSRNDVELLDKVDGYCLSIQSNHAAERNEEAYLQNLELLNKLGVKFPKRMPLVLMKTIGGLLRIKGTARSLTEEDVRRLPIASDPKEGTILRVLDMFAVVAYSQNPNLVPLIVFEMVKRLFRYGLAEHSCVGFAMLGFLMAGALQDDAATKNCYELALVAFERASSARVAPRLTCLSESFLAPWFKPLPDTLVPLERAYKQGLFSGDLESAGFAITFMVEYAFHTGRPLHQIDRDCAEYAERLEDFSQLKQKRMVLYNWRVCRMLLGESYGDDIFDLMEEIKDLAEINDIALLLCLRRSQIFLAGVMGDYERAAALSLEWSESIVKTLIASGGNIRLQFHAALSSLIMMGRGNKKYKRTWKKSSAWMRSWAEKGNPNCVHLVAILDAEVARQGGRANEAINAYETSMTLASQQQMIHEQALVCERYADLLFSIGRQKEGRSRLEESIQLYRKWGAEARVNALEEKLRALKR